MYANRRPNHLANRWQPPNKKSKGGTAIIPNHPISRDASNIAASTPPNATDSSSVDMFYPIYNGWLHPDKPVLLKEPAQGFVYQLTRFKKDGLDNTFEQPPDFMSYVGMVTVPVSCLEKTTMPFLSRNTSKLETAYFSKVDFYTLSNSSSILASSYRRCKEGLVQECKATLRDRDPCYQRSSNSIYYPDRKCPSSSSHDVGFMFNIMLHNKLHQTNDDFIKMEAKFLPMKSMSYMDTDKLMDRIQRHASSTTSNRIVISVCAGLSETEMKAGPESLCICLDNNKRSLYAAAFTRWHLHRELGIIFYHFDMKNGLLGLISSIAQRVDKPLIILFQHPSPEKSSKEAIAVAGRDCITALTDRMVDEIHFVHDHNPKKNCWASKALASLSMSKCELSLKSEVKVSEPLEIASQEEDTIRHPVFGNIARVGWAKFRGDIEMAFCITRVGY